MIPLRVRMENFLCYREPVELRFDGANVWVLCGPNGVGKSAIVDAMTYALFGEYRRSGRRDNRADDLIHRGARSFRVEFDFEYEGRRYRIWRARTRGGRTTQGVLTWLDIDSGPEPIAGVDSVRAVDDWVATTLGLTFETFISAALLRQGEAERLLDADRAERMKVLHGILDLERYKQLHLAVVDETKGLRQVVKDRRATLNGMLCPSPEESRDAEDALKNAESDLATARTTEKETRSLIGPAHTWETLDGERKKLEEELLAAESRALNASKIQERMQRLTELRALVPALEEEACARRRATVARGRYEQAKRTHERAKTVEEGRKKSVAAFTSRATDHEASMRELQRAIAAAELKKHELETVVERAKSAKTLRSERETLQRKLADYPADLDGCLARGETEATAASRATLALPHLRYVARYREAYQKATVEHALALNKITEVTAERVRCAIAETEADRADNEADTRLKTAATNLDGARALYEDAAKRRDRFTTTPEASVCSECGQAIDATHRERELRRLAERVEAACATGVTLKAEHEAAKTERNNATDALNKARCRHKEAQSAVDTATRDRDDASTRMARSGESFDHARDDTPEPYRAQIADIEADGFPTKADLDALTALSNQESQKKTTLKAWQNQVDERKGDEKDLATCERAIALLGKVADSEDSQEKLDEIEKDLSDLRTRHERHETQRDAARAGAARAAAKQQKAQDRLGRINQKLGSAQHAAITATTSHTDALAAARMLLKNDEPIPEAAPLVEEKDALEASDVEAEYAALAADRALDAERRRKLEGLRDDIEKIKPRARRPVSEVEAEAEDATREVTRREANRQAASDTLKELCRQETAHAEAAATLDAKARELHLHERIGELLSERGLRRDLVREAEIQILQIADEVLGRLSDGELRLDRTTGESETAFDLVVRRSGCDGPISAANLSGGQRFRVAVALALAVCRFAGRQARPLDSIFVDEGFGVLDRPGREAMVRLLRDGQGLRRVIVVSHQDDVADAFPVGYRLESVDGATVARPFTNR